MRQQEKGTLYPDEHWLQYDEQFEQALLVNATDQLE
jgi:hypothetical protein